MVVVFVGYVQNLISVEAPGESSALIFCQLHQAVGLSAQAKSGYVALLGCF